MATRRLGLNCCRSKLKVMRGAGESSGTHLAEVALAQEA